jgi:hypothetical protein
MVHSEIPPYSIAILRVLLAIMLRQEFLFAQYLRLQYPSPQARFERIHNAYTARLSAVIERTKSDGTVCPSLASKDAATMFLSLLQGLGFQFAIARLPIKPFPEAERIFEIYLQGITSPADAGKRARRTVETAKNRPKTRRQVT